jgi:hypothetical protein
MKATSVIRQLDLVHGLFHEASQENESAVLRTLASLIGSMPALDKPHNDPDYWRDVALNLNTLADDLETEANDGIPLDRLTDEDWSVADLLAEDN